MFRSATVRGFGLALPVGPWKRKEGKECPTHSEVHRRVYAQGGVAGGGTSCDVHSCRCGVKCTVFSCDIEQRLLALLPFVWVCTLELETKSVAGLAEELWNMHHI